jgi:hypothetical protein
MMRNKRTPKRFAPEVLALFRRARALRDQNPNGDAFCDANMDLHMALDRAPWDMDMFEALDEYRDTDITSAMVNARRGHPVVAQWGLVKAARDLGLELERLDRVPG